MFRFDSKGEFITDDIKIIERAIGRFDHAEIKIESIGERVKKTMTVPPLTITITQDSGKTEIKKYSCKHCGEAFESPIELAHHTKQNHPKNKE